MKQMILMIGGVVAISAGTHVKVPKLEFDMDLLEDVITPQTMEVHVALFERYTKQFNNALNLLLEEGKSSSKKLQEGGVLNVLMNLDEVKNEELQTALRNYGGGYINHYMFFKQLINFRTKQSSKTNKPKGELMDAIKQNFGSFEEFQKIFEQAQMSVFGCGWAWLVVEQTPTSSRRGQSTPKLAVVTTQQQDNPIMFESKKMIIPILGNDLFEHSYILNVLKPSTDKVVMTPHQAKQEYVNNFLQIVDWRVIENLFEKVTTEEELSSQQGSSIIQNYFSQEEQEQESENVMMNKQTNLGRQRTSFKKLTNPEELYIFS